MNARREGFALAAAVLAMMVVGAIVTGGFYAASQSSQVAKSTDAGDLALYIAETGLNAAMATNTATTLQTIQVNTEVPGSVVNVSYGGRVVGRYRVFITRMSGALFIVRSQGEVTLGGPYSGATRSVAAVVRTRVIDFDNNTAVQVYGNLTVTGNSTVSSNNYQSGTWSSCPTAPTGTSAVLANPTSTVSTEGSGNISGSTTREAMDSADFNVFGDMGFDEVASLANYRFMTTQTVDPQPYLIGAGPSAICNTDHPSQENWGAPTTASNACFGWFPIIEAVQGLRIAGNGSGQGILLVRGDLEMSGGFTFYGVVVVQGELRMTGTGGHVSGTLITFGNGDLTSTSSTLGNATVQYSSCAIDRAENGNSRLNRGSPIANRSWMDISNIQSY